MDGGLVGWLAVFVVFKGGSERFLAGLVMVLSLAWSLDTGMVQKHAQATETRQRP